MGLFDDDICWCADSDKCKNKECFRHFDNFDDFYNRTHTPRERIFTMGHLMWTEYCELTKESEE